MKEKVLIGIAIFLAPFVLTAWLAVSGKFMVVAFNWAGR